MLRLLLVFTLGLFSVHLWANESLEQNHTDNSQVEKSIVENSNVNTVDLEKQNRENQLQSMFSKLEITQGIATFTQKKHLSFLKNPIVSKGILKIHQNNVIWQVQSPVFSKLVIIDDQVWQLVTKDSNNYQLMVSNASIETLIRAMFTGDISQSQWHASIDAQQCLQLSPNDMILSQAIQQISVCVSENQVQRLVTIKDAQNNLTEIDLLIIAEQLSEEELRDFIINP